MIKVGKPAPAFALESSEGGTVELAKLEGSPVVVYFYPRDSTPGCTLEGQEFTKLMAKFKKAGAKVFGVSKDTIASHCKFRDKYDLTVPLLTDPDGKMMKAYDAYGEKTLYGKKTVGIIRSTVLIDGEGNVAQHWPKVKAAGHAQAVLDALLAL